jgi:pimeloyl-ACP methyl ester carboxylesterase
MSSETEGTAAVASEAVRQVTAAAGAVMGDVADGRWVRAGRRAGLFGVSVGVIAAGAAVGLAAERLTVGRAMRRRAQAELDAAAPFGSLRGAPRTVAADDGTELYVELDGTGWGGLPMTGPVDGVPLRPVGESGDGQRRGGRFSRSSMRTLGARLGLNPAQPLTVVFCHGYCLNQDCWHFQRAALREGMRLVFWDQRSHGRSERGRAYQAGEPATIDQLGRDLGAVIEAVAPTGPLVLVGHSMGGMTIMALADQQPELFRDRVAGVALIGTTAGNWHGVTVEGLPEYGARLLHRVAPGVLKALGRQVALVERGRKAGNELTALLYRKFSFGTENVDPLVARFAERMIDSTPIDVVAEFYPAFGAHDKVAALDALQGRPVLVLGGTRDLLTPPRHSEAIAAAIPGAELVLVPDAGHLVLLERPELVSAHLAALLVRAADAGRAAPLPPAVRELAAEAAAEETTVGSAAEAAAADPASGGSEMLPS